ncbi:MAG: adenylate/guanylate cyclase domain-containing protein [Planctomycetota bacterium]
MATQRGATRSAGSKQKVSITQFARWPVLVVMALCGVAVTAIDAWRPTVFAGVSLYQFDVFKRNDPADVSIDDRLVFFAIGDDVYGAITELQQQYAAQNFSAGQTLRLMHVQTLQGLAQAGAAGAVWDVLFDQPTRGNVDDLLAQSMAAVPNVLMVQASDDVSASELPSSDKLAYAQRFRVGRRTLAADTLPVKPIELRSLQLEKLADVAAGSGHVRWAVDADGKNRRVDLVARVGNVLFPSMALAGVIELLKIDRDAITMDGRTLVLPLPPDEAQRYGKDAIRVPLTEDGELLINQIPRWRDRVELDMPYFEYDSQWATLSEFPEDMAATLNGKLVLMGSTAGELDQIPTPLDRAMPGALVTFNAMNTVLTEQFIWPASRWWTPVLTILMPLLAGAVYYTLFYSPRVAGGVTSLLFIGLIGLSAWLFWAQSVWLPIGSPLVAMAGAVVIGSAITLVQISFRASKLAELLARFVSPALLRELYLYGLRGQELGVERVEVTVMFTDVKGFTTLTERSEPEEIAEFLGLLYPMAMQVLEDTHGTLDKFLGDGILAYWGAPDALQNKEQWACEAGLLLQERFAEIADKMKAKGRGDMQVRVGIATGYVTAGYLGGKKQAAYTVVGRPVNMAARLEAACRPGHVQIEKKTAAQAEDVFELNEVEPLTLKGIATPVQAWEVAGLREGESIRGA